MNGLLRFARNDECYRALRSGRGKLAKRYRIRSGTRVIFAPSAFSRSSMRS